MRGCLSCQCDNTGFQMMIREFEYGDIQHIMEIAYYSLEDYYSPDFFISIWQVSPEGFLVAEEGGEIVGFVLGVISDAATLRILMICVKREYRRMGIGSALLKGIVNRFEGLRKIHLEVKVTNTDAIRLYRKHGFTIKRELPDFYPDGTDGYLMEKLLM